MSIRRIHHSYSRENSMDKPSWTFSDTIAGYVSSCERDEKTFGLRTNDDREFQVKLTDATYAELVQNLDEPFQDLRGRLESVISPGRYLFAHGIFYPEAGEVKFAAKR